MATRIIQDASLTPGVMENASIHLTVALRAIRVGENDAFILAVTALRGLGVTSHTITKAALAWVKAYPWETAAIAIPIILLSLTPAILGAVGFTASGVLAGQEPPWQNVYGADADLHTGSLAASIQAGIGNVAAGSIFATLTSAAMGGYGVLAVFASVWAVPSAVLGAVAAWKRWGTSHTGEEEEANVEGERGGRDRDDNEVERA